MSTFIKNLENKCYDLKLGAIDGVWVSSLNSDDSNLADDLENEIICVNDINYESIK